jgi:hypothetical protein
MWMIGPEVALSMANTHFHLILCGSYRFLAMMWLSPPASVPSNRKFLLCGDSSQGFAKL